jgi:hypothetical protein
VRGLEHIPKADIAAVRRLDVQWAHRYMERISGRAFQAGPSEVTGEWFEADDVALVMLHQVRLKVGSKTEAKKSKAWLRERRLRGLFGQPLDQN